MGLFEPMDVAGGRVREAVLSPREQEMIAQFLRDEQPEQSE